MKVTLAVIGKCKRNSPVAMLVEEYVKRSHWQIVVKEKDNASQAQEAAFLTDAIPPQAKVIVLDERGEALRSTELAQKIGEWQLNGTSEICFLIGGADGHLETTRQRADLVLSFGRLTLPHMLMRAVLAEQIYRVQTILEGHPYHRD